MARFDSCGNHLWSRSVGTANSPFVGKLALGPDGAVVASGAFVDSIDFGAGPLYGDSINETLFLARLTPAQN